VFPNQESFQMTRAAFRAAIGALTLAAGASALAAPTSYEFDPHHTYPSFEADHMGMSLWRGKFNKTTGTMTLDKAAGSGTLDATIDLTSVDFGMDEMNAKAQSDEFFDVAKYPTATYHAKLTHFKDGKPTVVEGDLTLHGVTKPVKLTIDKFGCKTHPMFKKEWCGGDAVGTFQRDAFGLTAGKDWGFDMTVTLRVQMESLAKD
jgi:polyisoprenoid-binding protein YceI